MVETEKYFGIVLEYASGGELFEYIVAHRSLKEKDARRLFAQLISSVQYMHRKKIVHRDLKLVINIIFFFFLFILYLNFISS